MLFKVRQGENLHIVLWLLKDLCWVMDLRWAGLTLVAPTVAVALWIAWGLRHDRSDLIHAIAVVLWIAANSTWMIGEFFFADGSRPLAVAFFVAGLLLLGWHYLQAALRARGRI
ncbi:MAG: hypothetical protein MUE88_10045 [Flavobacteriales bacterium]|jgi:hypothetical protein|nr:hypothetical protein [Flavobacteriales bacterium]